MKSMIKLNFLRC